MLRACFFVGSVNVISSHQALISCHDCGHIYDKPRCDQGEQMGCVHCGKVLHKSYKGWEAKVASFTLTAIILFIVANLLPFMSLELTGQTQHNNLISGVQALIERKQFILSAVVFVTIFLFPLLEISCLSYVLGCYFTGRRTRGLGQTLHFLHLSQPWSMLEIFLLGILIASIKLGHTADVVVGPGLYAYIGLVFMLIAALLYLDRDHIWEWWEPNNYFVGVEGEAVHACHCCEAHIGVSLLEADNECPRCSTNVYARWPRSEQKTLALLVAALLLYIPANTLPIMSTTNVGETIHDTILSGVVHLAEEGDLPIAIIVFCASIVVPIIKLLVMFYLLWNVSVKSQGNPRQMAFMFRLTEFIGRWSMIDVFVVTILVALVQFGLIANVEPGPAIVSFAGVVVLTMLAAETFDPKLIWDAYHAREDAEPAPENAKASFDDVGLDSPP